MGRARAVKLHRYGIPFISPGSVWGRVTAVAICAMVVMSCFQLMILLLEFSVWPSVASSVVNVLSAIHPLPSVVLAVPVLLGVCVVGYGAYRGCGFPAERYAWLEVVLCTWMPRRRRVLHSPVHAGGIGCVQLDIWVMSNPVVAGEALAGCRSSD